MTDQSTMHEVTKNCIPNIGPRERRKRYVSGALATVVAVTVLSVLLISGADRWWRVLLLLPFWASTLGFYQAREKT